MKMVNWTPSSIVDVQKKIKPEFLKKGILKETIYWTFLQKLR